jgi:hypothetical protein
MDCFDGNFFQKKFLTSIIDDFKENISLEFTKDKMKIFYNIENVVRNRSWWGVNVPLIEEIMVEMRIN